MKFRKLMLIDDDQDDQELFQEALRKIDVSISCKVFDGAIPAFSHLEKNKHFFDLIFLDLNMPIMNGNQFLKKLRGHDDLKEIPVIIFSTTSNRQILDESKKLGALGYHTKPHSFEKLVFLLSSILTGW